MAEFSGNTQTSDFSLEGRRYRGKRSVIGGHARPEFGGTPDCLRRRGLRNLLGSLGDIREDKNARPFGDLQDAAGDREGLHALPTT